WRDRSADLGSPGTSPAAGADRPRRGRRASDRTKTSGRASLRGWAEPLDGILAVSAVVDGAAERRAEGILQCGGGRAAGGASDRLAHSAPRSGLRLAARG